MLQLVSFRRGCKVARVAGRSALASEMMVLWHESPPKASARVKSGTGRPLNPNI